MKLKFLMITAVAMFGAANSQNGAASFTMSQGTGTTPAAAASSTPIVPANQASSDAASTPSQTTYLDYKSVYEAATVEDEVKMATERFSLTPSQQDMWLVAARDRRAAEKQAQEKLESKSNNYSREGVYLGLRSAQNTFHETIVGYLTPAQKQTMETDRLILMEKQRRLAKLPPPPPPAPKDTVVPVDSAAIKAADAEKAKGKKKAKKKKKAA